MAITATQKVDIKRRYDNALGGTGAHDLKRRLMAALVDIPPESLDAALRDTLRFLGQCSPEHCEGSLTIVRAMGERAERPR